MDPTPICELGNLIAQYQSIVEGDESLNLHSTIMIWITYYDRVQKRDALANLNTMQHYGMLLCCCIARSYANSFDEMSIGSFLSDKKLCVLVPETTIQELTWRDLLDILHQIQTNLENIFQPSTLAPAEENVFSCSEDIIKLLVVLLYRAGYFMGKIFKFELEEKHDFIFSFFQVVDGDENLYQLSSHTGREFLDNMHVCITLAHMLLNCKKIPESCDAQQNVEIANCHREASLDDFYTLSMISDVYPGGITFYKNKFYHLFHSVSQVIYYNMPSYHRQKQLSLVELQAPTAAHINLLPLYQQLAPNMQVLYEHTGAGFYEAHQKQQACFLVFGKFVLVADADMQTWWHPELGAMFAFVQRLTAT